MKQYDAVVIPDFKDVTQSGARVVFVTIQAAIDAGKTNIYVTKGEYRK